MFVSQRARVSAGRSRRAGFLGLECLREICLLCGGMAIVMGLLNGADQSGTESMTAAMKAGAAAEANPTQPVYQICVQADQQTAWLRRGQSSLVQVSLTNGEILNRLPVLEANVAASDHSGDGRIHACSTVPGGISIIRDGVVLIDEPQASVNRSVYTLAISPDGTHVAAAGNSNDIVLWDLSSERPVRRTSLQSFPPVAIAWSHDSARLLVGGEGGHFAVLRSDGAAMWKIKHDIERVTALAWSPDDSQIAAGAHRGDVVVLRSTDGAVQWRNWQDLVQVSAIAYAPDGNRLAIGGFDRTVDVLSAHDGSLLVTMPGHFDTVRALQFLSDGDRIVTGSLDGTLRIWSTSAGREVVKF